MTDKQTFFDLLAAQVRHEFTASQQYTAMAVWSDQNDLPQMARLFYAQALEERNHAMMMVEHLLVRDVPVAIPGVDDVRNDFAKPTDVLEVAHKQEVVVTEQIEALFQAARSAADPLSEQFMLWFLKEQTEEMSSMRTLLTIAQRAEDDWFKLEEYLAREATTPGKDNDPQAPQVAGGPL